MYYVLLKTTTAASTDTVFFGASIGGVKCILEGKEERGEEEQLCVQRA